MKTTKNSFVACVLALLFFATHLSAAEPDQTTIYRLDSSSTFQQGCFSPCLCPIWSEMSVRGTFALTPAHTDFLMSTYALHDVNWTISMGDSEVRVTGGGKFHIGGRFAYLQRLELDLQVGDQPAQHFDSGWQPAKNFPDINALLSVNNMVCFDTVFSIKSQPVPQRELIDLTVVADSTYQQGCFDPCLCPIWEQQPLAGTFTLVPVLNLGTYREYNVVNLDLNASGGDIPLQHIITGTGTYIQIDGFAGTIDHLALDLTIDGFDPKHFEGGSSLVSVNFPEIDVTVSMNNMVCYDIVLHIHAKQDDAPALVDHAVSPVSTTTTAASQPPRLR